jgi:hypothetical protein
LPSGKTNGQNPTNIAVTKGMQAEVLLLSGSNEKFLSGIFLLKKDKSILRAAASDFNASRPTRSESSL